MVGGGKFGVIEIANASSNLAVGTIQAFLDAFLKDGGAEKIDYVHGTDVVTRLGWAGWQRGLLPRRHE